MEQTLCFDFKSHQEIKGIYGKRTGKFSRLLLFQETRQILVAVILHNKLIYSSVRYL